MSFWNPKLELPEKAFGYPDILRVEYEYEEEGTLYELAAKATPDFAEISGYPRQLRPPCSDCTCFTETVMRS